MRAWFRAILILAVACAAASTVTADEAVAERYARWPEVRGVVVSPANSHAAFLVPIAQGRIGLAVVDLADPSQRKVVAGFADVDIVEAHWVNDRRLVFYAQAPWENLAYDRWGTFAVDRDGENLRQIISGRSDTEAATGSAIRQKVLPRGWELWKPVGDGSESIYVRRWLGSMERGFRPSVLARIDTRTLELTTLSDGQPAGTDHWIFDAKGDLRVVTASVKDRRQLWWRPVGAVAWELVDDQDYYQGAMVEPLALEADGTLIVAARAGRDTTALHVYDLPRRRLDPEPLVGVAGFDVKGLRFDNAQRRVVAAVVHAQLPTTVWFDDGPARIQAMVDKALPAGRSNRLLCGNCVGARRVVVHSESDRQPGEYYLYDAAASRLTLLATTRPWIDERTQGRRSFHRVAARDGLSLPVVVTHPPAVAAGQPAPTVLLVHGGPFAPGADLTWDAEPQFLAARGYRVLEVSFRGTTGLGWKHQRAAWGQWGLSMQDDLEDALLWAVQEKLTDPQRVCIYGGSYGGYAALMGPVRHPGRYRCAISHVGVTDITLLYSGNWTDMDQTTRTYGMSALVGDLQRDAERLRQTSPLHRVADIKVPVLVVQGRRDRRVDPVHADRFVSAARAAGVDIQRVDYEDGHHWYWAKSHADFLGKLDEFLARHLKSR